MRCDECRFWVPVDEPGGSKRGECRRHPPVLVSAFLVYEVQKDWRGYFPESDSDDWCGEFEAKAASRDEEQKAQMEANMRSMGQIQYEEVWVDGKRHVVKNLRAMNNPPSSDFGE